MYSHLLHGNALVAFYPRRGCVWAMARMTPPTPSPGLRIQKTQLYESGYPSPLRGLARWNENFLLLGAQPWIKPFNAW